MRVGRGGGGRDSHPRDPRRARHRRGGRVRARARGGARGGRRRRLRRPRLVTADGRQPALGARRASRRSDAGAGARAPRGGGRALSPDGAARGRADRARGAASDALQHRRAGDRRLWLGARRRARGLGARARRARVGGRDPAVAPGRAPDGMGARRAGYPVLRDRGRSSGVAHGRRGRRRRAHRRRPDRGQRRRGEQGRHLRPRGRSRAPWLCRSTSSRRPRRWIRAPRAGRTSRSRRATRARSPRAFRRRIRRST